MRWLYLVAVALTAASVGTLVGCGGVVLGTSKMLAEPLGLQGRSADANAVVSVDGLTTHLSASGALQFAIEDRTSSESYEGLSRVELAQNASLLFSIVPDGALPATFTLRNVNLRIIVRVAESGGTPVAPPVEFTYTGSLTLDRQSDGRYKARESLLLQRSLDRFDGSSLIAILGSGGVNTVSVNIFLTADTSSPNIPSGATVSMSLQFGEGSATVRW